LGVAASWPSCVNRLASSSHSVRTHRAAATPCRAAHASARSDPFVRRALCPLAFAFGVRHWLLSPTISQAHLVCRATPARQALSVSHHHVSPTLPSSGLPNGSRSRQTLGAATMKCRNSGPVRFFNTGGVVSSVVRDLGRSSRCGTSLNWSTASATQPPKLSVRLGAKLKFISPSQQVGVSPRGVVQTTTSSRSSPCVSSPPSRTLVCMKSQSRFFSVHAVWRTQSSSVHCYFGPHQNPAPNPSIKRTCLRQAAYLQRWA